MFSISAKAEKSSMAHRRRRGISASPQTVVRGDRRSKKATWDLITSSSRTKLGCGGFFNLVKISRSRSRKTKLPKERSSSNRADGRSTSAIRSWVCILRTISSSNKNTAERLNCWKSWGRFALTLTGFEHVQRLLRHPCRKL